MRFSYCYVGCLDACLPSPEVLVKSAEEVLRWKCSIYVHCMHGHGRSLAFCLVYLVLRGDYPDIQSCYDHIKLIRPKVSISKKNIARYQRYLDEYGKGRKEGVEEGVEPVAEPVTVSVAEPVAEPVTVSVAEPVAVSVAEPIPQSTSEPPLTPPSNPPPHSPPHSPSPSPSFCNKTTHYINTPSMVTYPK